MVCSAQQSWELPPAAQPPWSLPRSCDLQPLRQDVDLPLLPADFAAPSPFGEAMPPLPPLPLPPLPVIDQQLLSVAAPAAAASQLFPSSSGSDRSTKIEQRLERMRAKNRRAQARYREKQKAQREQFELTYAQVASELEEARRLNAELRAAVAVQEAVRANREAVEATLQATARLQQGAQQQHCSDACTCDAEGAASCWQLQPFQRRVALYFQVGRACEPMRQLLEHCTTGPALRSLEPSTKHELRQRMARSMPMLVANVQSTTLAELMQEWAAFCEFATEVTSAVDGGRLGEAEGEERVRPALEYIAIVKQLSLMHNAETYRQMLLRTRLPGEMEDTATARWRQAALASGITREQAERMLPHYQLCMQRQAELGAELVGGMAALQRSRQELAARHSPLHATLSGMSEQYVSLFEASGAVEHQTRSALLILHDFMGSSGRVLTSLQKARIARCCIGSGGSGQRTAVYPDVIAITREVLARHSLLPPQPEQ